MENDIWKEPTFNSKYAVVYDTTPWWKRIFRRRRKLVLYINFETGKAYIKKRGKWREQKEKK